MGKHGGRRQGELNEGRKSDEETTKGKIRWERVRKEWKKKTNDKRGGVGRDGRWKQRREHDDKD